MLVKSLSFKSTLIGSFLAIAAVTFVVASYGVYQVMTLGEALYEVGVVRLPSIEGLAMMNVAQASIEGAEHILIQESLEESYRNKHFKEVKEAWKSAERGWQIYEPLPQTPEESVLWRKFIPAWKRWKGDHEVFMQLCLERDQKRAQHADASTLAILNQKLLKQAHQINPASLKESAELLEKITRLNHDVAEKSKQASVESFHDLVRIVWTVILVSVGGVAAATFFGVHFGISINNRIEAIVDAIPTALVSLDKEGFVIQWNRGATALTGISVKEAMGRAYGEVLPDFEDWISKGLDCLKNRVPIPSGKVSLFKSDHRLCYEAVLYPLNAKGVTGYVLSIEDITEHTRMQELMLQTEKMMTVGGLAAGMAHEINNPLGIIAQAVSNIERRVFGEIPANQKVADSLQLKMEVMREYFKQREIPRFIQDIQGASSRAAQIVANMLQFSRKSEAALHPVNLIDLIEQVIALASSDYDLKKRYDFKSVEIRRDFASEMPVVRVVVVEIEQVLFNLLKNAVQSMVENPRERKPCLSLRLYAKGDYAVIEIQDNGPGMSEEVRGRVFEPFFTTKKVGVGTGLGLSVSYAIITKNHHGQIHVESSPGSGAKFVIQLPLSKQAEHLGETTDTSNI